MPVAADHVKKERAPGVLESLDQLRADRKKAIAAAKPKYITHDPGYADPELVPSVRKTKPKKQKVVHEEDNESDDEASKVPDAQTLQGLTLGLRPVRDKAQLDQLS